MPRIHISTQLLPTEDVTDNYHGTCVPDPYRWLENPENQGGHRLECKSPKRSHPKHRGRAAIYQQFNKRLTALWNYPKKQRTAPQSRPILHILQKNDGLQNQPHSLQTSQPGRPLKNCPIPAPARDGDIALMGQNYN
ncbi:MAG: hypothetical protein H6656_10205 [Ardenticatenaceae bacterium]|nr:hypothetical protein [Ardenticatenaceae bacterium]